MVNIYTIVEAHNLKSIRVRRNHAETCEPEVNDVVFLDENPVAKVLTVTEYAENLFDVTFDRNVWTPIGNLLAIGVP